MTERTETTPYYRLSTVAMLCGMSPNRVRTYVRQGFVGPARVQGKQLYFGDAEIAQLRRIRRLSDDLGLNLAGIEVTLRLLDEVSRLQSLLAERQQTR